MIFTLLFLSGGKCNQHQFFCIMFERLLQQSKQIDRRCCHFFVEIEGEEGCEVVTEIERVFDFVANIGRAVVPHKAIQTVINNILSPSLLFLFLLSARLAAHHLWFYFH